MTPAGFSALQAIADLRRTAAAVVALCDVVLYAQEGEAARAVRVLPARVRALMFRARRVLTALESEGSS
jgi:hypothetical protein